MKTARYYEIVGESVYIYDKGNKELSQSVSVVSKSDLQFYRNNFKLSKIWS